MKCAHIVPVGTSLLASFARSPEGSRVVDEYKIAGWDRLAPDDPKQSIICDRFEELKDLLMEYLNLAGETASAELSSLIRAIRGLGCDPSETQVVLYATNTCNSKLAMRVIAEYLRREGFKVRSEIIKTARSEDELDEAMMEVVEKVLRETTKMTQKGHQVCVNATPGFKIESAYLTIAALIAGVNCIYYMHEAFKDIVYMPTPPLQIREEYKQAIQKLEKPTPREEAERIIEKTMIEELKTRRIIEEKEGKIKAKPWALEITKLT